MEKRYNAGLYLRLSLEDASNSAKRGNGPGGNPFQNESASIENQRAILTEYADLRGWNVSRVYADDGYSGGRFDNRPGFAQMTEDAREGLIDLILTKDLSRLGRDYIEVGRYTDEVFPSLGVRFIALMDNIDTEGDSDLLPFRSILNDYHLKDLSRKIKSVLRAKAEAGEYVGAHAPYGYEKDAERPGRLVIDEEAAAAVRRIFDLRIQKTGMAKIAGILNDDGVPCPTAHRAVKKGRAARSGHGAWQFQTVKLILANEAYLGHSVKFRKGTVSYKNGRVINKPEEDWIRVTGTHEPIISRDLWNAAQAVDLKRYDPAKRKKPERSLFSGLLVCADCGGAFCRSACGGAKKDGVKVRYGYYDCSLHTRSGKSKCGNHRITESALLSFIREDVRGRLALIDIDGNRMASELKKRFSGHAVEDARKRLAKSEARLGELDALSAKLYEDRLNGVVSLETYMALSAETESERGKVASERDGLCAAVRETENAALDTDRWVAAMRSYMSLENPDYDAIHGLIEKIEIGAREGTGRGARQNIEIHYGFAAAADLRKTK
jgi:DNA invertase Pin-like site-specific DNA recombinase